MVGKYLSSIIIYYDGDTGLPHGFEMTTPKSDKTGDQAVKHKDQSRD